MQHAFKEWASVCRAITDGKQTIILRKGGIHERGGAFRVEHKEFFLFPTYHHEHAAGLKPEFAHYFAEAEQNRIPGGIASMNCHIEVPFIAKFTDLDAALSLDRFHAFSEATVRNRFRYQSPSIYVMVVRAHKMKGPLVIKHQPEWDGCKSWVDVGRDWTVSSRPVLDDAAIAEVVEEVRRAAANQKIVVPPAAVEEFPNVASTPESAGEADAGAPQDMPPPEQ